jgi:hypothetical protein
MSRRAVVLSMEAAPHRWPRNRAARTLLVLLVAGLLIGTATHVENLVRAGLTPRPELPRAANLFWSALVVVDPLTILALLFRPRAGVVLVAILLAVDVTVNLATLGVTGPVVAQISYGLLALIAVPVVRRSR